MFPFSKPGLFKPSATSAAAKQTPANFAAPTLGDKRIAARIDVGGAPWTMAVGDGLIWVIAGSSIVRIDPQTNQVVDKPIPAPLPANADHEAMVVGEDALWTTTVGWGDLAAPNAMDAVSRIDPQTGETVATIKVSRGPLSLALTPGIVWVVNFGDADTVCRIDIKTNQITGEPINQVIANIPVPSEPHRVAFGEGAVWVGNWHDNSVSRIDPQTNQVIDTIPLGGHPVDVKITENAVWVSVQNPDMVMRFKKKLERVTIQGVVYI